MIKRVILFLGINWAIVYAMTFIEQYLPFYEVMAAVLTIPLYMHMAYVVTKGLSVRYRKEFLRVIAFLVFLSAIVVLIDLSYPITIPSFILTPFYNYLMYGNFASYQLVLMVESNYPVVNFLIIYFATQILLYSSISVHTYKEYREKRV